MTHWRWTLVGLLAACGDPGNSPGDVSFLVPGVTNPTEIRVAGAVPGSGFATDIDACLVRYDFAGSDPDAECRTETVGGDRVTTCPTHPFLPSRVEITHDAAGRKTYEAREYSDAPFPERANSYHYDAQGRLAEVRGDAGVDGSFESTMTITEFTVDGLPVHSSITAPDFEILGVTYEGTGQQDVSYSYDSHGRLIGTLHRFSVRGGVLADTTITYDDAARMRIWEVIVDISSEVPTAGGAGRNGGFERFDEDGRLVEVYWFGPDDADEYRAVLRYDEAGRLLTVAHDGRWQYTAHAVHDCP